MAVASELDMRTVDRVAELDVLSSRVAWAPDGANTHTPDSSNNSLEYMMSG